MPTPDPADASPTHGCGHGTPTTWRRCSRTSTTTSCSPRRSPRACCPRPGEWCAARPRCAHYWMTALGAAARPALRAWSGVYRGESLLVINYRNHRGESGQRGADVRRRPGARGARHVSGLMSPPRQAASEGTGIDGHAPHISADSAGNRHLESRSLRRIEGRGQAAPLRLRSRRQSASKRRHQRSVNAWASPRW